MERGPAEKDSVVHGWLWAAGSGANQKLGNMIWAFLSGRSFSVPLGYSTWMCRRVPSPGASGAKLQPMTTQEAVHFNMGSIHMEGAPFLIQIKALYRLAATMEP